MQHFLMSNSMFQTKGIKHQQCCHISPVMNSTVMMVLFSQARSLRFPAVPLVKAFDILFGISSWLMLDVLYAFCETRSSMKGVECFSVAARRDVHGLSCFLTTHAIWKMQKTGLQTCSFFSFKVIVILIHLSLFEHLTGLSSVLP